MGQNLPQVVKIARVSHRDQNISRTHAHRSAAQFLIAVDAELVKLLRLAVTLFCDVTLGESEYREENAAENHSGDRGLILGE